MTDSLHNLIAAQGDAVIPNLRYADLAAPTASYVIDKRCTRVPFLAPVYSPNNVSVARAIIADPGFLIPGSVYLSAEVHNTDPVANHRLQPLTGLEGAFQRGRLLSGMVLEDILEYARVGQIFHKLEPLTAQEEVNKLGFGVVADGDFDEDDTPGIAPRKKLAYIAQGQFKRVWHKPIFGLLNQNHWIPTQYAPLTFEFTLQDGAQWCDTSTRDGDGGGAGAAIPASTTYTLQNMYLYYDIATLDSQLNNQFANMLKSGGAMNFVYESALMTTNVVLNPDFTTQVLRNLARVKAIMITFSHSGDDKNKPGSNQMYLPPNSLVGEEGGTDTDLECFVTLGGKKLTTFPIGPRGAAEMYWRLQQAAGASLLSPLGITFQEFLNTDLSSNRQSFILALDTEKVSHAGFTGEDFGGGRQLLIDVKRAGTIADCPERVHVLLIHETAMSVTESGVMVSM